MQNDREKLKKKGFTLIEILVVTAIFGTLMIAVAGLFVSVLRTERSILASKKVLGQISYATEYMSRALRMAEKDKGQGCITSGSNYEVNVAKDSIKFRNALQGGDCQEFFLDTANQQLEYRIGIGTPDEDVLDLTSSPDIIVDNLQFEISGETETDDLQPFVTIYLEAQTTDSPTLKVQTSVSQRNPDIR